MDERAFTTEDTGDTEDNELTQLFSLIGAIAMDEVAGR